MARRSDLLYHIHKQIQKLEDLAKEPISSKMSELVRWDLIGETACRINELAGQIQEDIFFRKTVKAVEEDLSEDEISKQYQEMKEMIEKELEG